MAKPAIWLTNAKKEFSFILAERVSQEYLTAGFCIQKLNLSCSSYVLWIVHFLKYLYKNYAHVKIVDLNNIFENCLKNIKNCIRGLEVKETYQRESLPPKKSWGQALVKHPAQKEQKVENMGCKHIL